MASACVNNISLSPPENNFHPTPTYSSTCWLTDLPSKAPLPASNPPEIQETAAGDFEFRLEEEPLTMLPADELFSDGKLVPLHLSSLKQHPPVTVSSQETPKSCSRQVETGISVKAPRSSSRWRGFLGLKKSSQNINNQPPKSDNNPKSLKHFLNRSSKSSSADSSLNLPLLKNSDNYEPVPVSSSSRLSLSSSSSSHEHEDVPRLSLDTEKASFNNNPSPNPFAPCRMRIVKPKPGAGSDTDSQIAGDGGTQTNDSPRMNSSGKIMFQSLERSSSSPSSFNGGPRFKQGRGMERSNSANVRVSPVLNVVPLRGSSKSASVFGFFSSSSPQKCKSRKQQRATAGARQQIEINEK
ncbi:S-adenosyl-L-methionine-dependent methyltransferases superfamily protein, putative isoform 1 [Hibiscus syriacus]|uniref:S-adenosyl-L-methionine-dependent methyltransferases superfamily protein, putative isoform 1 n=1 Tax=Hibiscus syriacus TaxID=106335 RepID=A0A6A2Z859_HIBSY|nr:S-adenosyl-L-methionine-dependent methyltransferases superfamily protein, putative isoform 1 [Hibiscus syriacus]